MSLLTIVVKPGSLYVAEYISQTGRVIDVKSGTQHTGRQVVVKAAWTRLCDRSRVELEVESS